MVQTVSTNILGNGQIQQLDLNPVVVQAKGASVADTRILSWDKGRKQKQRNPLYTRSREVLSAQSAGPH